MLAEAGDEEEHGEAVGGLTPGTVEFVLEEGVFEGDEVERGGVSHEAQGDVVGEEVGEEGIAEAHDASEEVGGENQANFDGEVAPEGVG